MLFNTILSSISVISWRSAHLSMFSWSFLTSTPYDILSKPLAAFSHNHCWNNRQSWDTTWKKKSFENIVEKGENEGNQHFLLFSQCFSTLPKTNFNFSVTFILSSENVFNLDQSKNMLFGNELTHYNTIPHFDALKKYSCGKHWDKQFLLFSQCFLPYMYMVLIFHFKRSSAVCFNLEQSKNLLFVKMS